MSEVIDILVSNEVDESSYIMVIGVGGGGGNAVQYMYDIGVHNVNFLVCNTDAQALRRSNMPVKIQLGSKLINGLGAGNQPEKGRDAALETAEEITEKLIKSNVRMVFITAGMGGGTGTGAAPVIAKIAKDLGILTVGIVTIPFRLEGPKRLRQAESGLEEIKQYVDSLIVIDNENICKMYGDLDFSDAFSKADDILAIAAKGIAEAITKEHKVNVDFADVFTTMSNSGIALLGYSSAEVNSENVAIELTEHALQSPLLNQNNITGAQDIMINISWNQKELKMGELHAIIGHVQAAAGSNANIIWGAGADSALKENEVSLIIIATRFGNAEKIDLGGNIHTDNMSGERGVLGEAKGEAKDESKTESKTESEEGEVVIEKVAFDPESNTTTNDAPLADCGSEYVLTDPANVAKGGNNTPEQGAKSGGAIEYVSLDDDEKPVAVKVPSEPTDIVIHEVAGANFDQITPRYKKSSDNRTPLPFADDGKEPEVVTEAHSDKTTEVEVKKPARKYTIDEIEALPAYKRREVLQKLNLEKGK